MLIKKLKALFGKRRDRKSEKNSDSVSSQEPIRSKKMEENDKVQEEKIKEEVKPEDKKENPTPAPNETEKETKKEQEGTTDKESEEELVKVETVEEEPAGNGVRVEDLVTKDILTEKLAAFEAKYDALIKENQDLKAELLKSQTEAQGLHNKYEKGDFGGNAARGLVKSDNHAQDTFESYSKQFM